MMGIDMVDLLSFAESITESWPKTVTQNMYYLCEDLVSEGT